jgi:type II secretory ATPase GspE/PulE/Tfp pilus assembly ATPase PilB-like protein
MPFDPADKEKIRRHLRAPNGIILCTGPTGSGKTTTLYGCLNHVNTPENKVISIEDPVEYLLPGVVQIPIRPSAGLTFAAAMRSVLRQDPDIIMLGEIRDQESLMMAEQAALTGHLVLTTLHTNSAPETVTRLLDMGMDPFNFADSLLAVLGQRLVRRLCTHCRTARPATEAEIGELLDDYLFAFPRDAVPMTRDALRADWLRNFAQDGRLMHFASPGCEHCARTGQKGRMAIHELMVVTRELRQQIQTGERAEVLQRSAMADGMKTLRQDGIEKVLQGFVSIEEVRATSNV